MKGFGWAAAVIFCALFVFAGVQNRGNVRKLEVANANAAMYDLAAEIYQYRSQNGHLPVQLAPEIKHLSVGGTNGTVDEIIDPFDSYRQRWPGVKLLDGMQHPDNKGVNIIYNPGVNDFDLMVYIGDRLVNQRKYK